MSGRVSAFKTFKNRRKTSVSCKPSITTIFTTIIGISILILLALASYYYYENTLLHGASSITGDSPLWGAEVPKNSKNSPPASHSPHTKLSKPGQNNPTPPAALIASRKTLANHPFKRLPPNKLGKMVLEDAMFYLHSQPECKNKPIFTSMAQVGTDLYWQLIENFVYTMVKFSLSDCAVMICVTDQNCMNMCEKNGFPCLYYDHLLHNPGVPLPSALEQIAHLKLSHLPKALSKGVDVLMMDLDVGFLQDPMLLLDGFFTPSSPLSKIDILVQKDMTFIMHRTVELWRTWYTEPMPNIGLIMVRGNERTRGMFDRAWADYQTITKNIKNNPGKDQNKVVEAMRATRNLKWKYFPDDSAILLDKLYKFEDKTFELGGVAAHRIFNKKGAIAVHTTCYEQKSKVMGLKAANAFWNPEYYDPNRKTITKKILMQDPQDFANELRSLIYLAVMTDRTLIIPNVLGYEEQHLNVQKYHDLTLWPGFRIVHIQQKKKKIEFVEGQVQTSEEDDEISENGFQKNNGLLSYFVFNDKSKTEDKNNIDVVDKSLSLGNEKENDKSEIMGIMKEKVEVDEVYKSELSRLKIVEPGFYWRVERDYAAIVPDPFILSFIEETELRVIEKTLLSPGIRDLPRILINMDNTCKHDRAAARKSRGKLQKYPFTNYFGEKNYDDVNRNKHKRDKLMNYHDDIINITSKHILNNIQLNIDLPNFILKPIFGWSKDSVGSYKIFEEEYKPYKYLPKIIQHKNKKKGVLNTDLAKNVITHVRPCHKIFEQSRGNRSCFDKCM